MTLQKIIHFPLTKIAVGIAVVAGSVVLGDWISNLFTGQVPISSELKNGITAIIQIALATCSYILMFKFYEKREIIELSLEGFRKYALPGFLTGLILQSLAIAVIYAANGYAVIKVNPVSFLIPSLTVALVAGFVAELLIRGIAFRLIEEKLGTVIALTIVALLFGILHAGNKGATVISVITVAFEAGILLSAVYVYTRSLWFSVFLHFTWDFAEPGIFGGINPGNSIEQSLFTSRISGHELLTGGQNGPQNSLQSLFFCAVASLLFLWLAQRKGNFKQPFWKK